MMPPRGKPVDLEKAALAVLRLGVRKTQASTPKAPYSADVLRLLADLHPNAQAVLLPFTETHPDYETAMCHGNVVHRVREAGGERVNGWMIWDHGVFAEAEFHAVWRNPDGVLVDITPRQHGEEFILFVEDADLKIRPREDTDGMRTVWAWVNRTSLPDCPYIMQGEPWPYPVVAMGSDARTDELHRRLGVETIAG